MIKELYIFVGNPGIIYYCMAPYCAAASRLGTTVLKRRYGQFDLFIIFTSILHGRVRYSTSLRWQVSWPILDPLVNWITYKTLSFWPSTLQFLSKILFFNIRKSKWWAVVLNFCSQIYNFILFLVLFKNRFPSLDCNITNLYTSHEANVKQ